MDSSDNTLVFSNLRQSERPLYHDKSLDMSKRLQVWKIEKLMRKQNSLNKDGNKRTWNSSTRCSGMTSDTPFSKSSKRKLKTSSKRPTPASKRDIYGKDTNLNMRTRLDSWLKEKGKTPQTPTLSKSRILKTPCPTPNQRRKTWSFPHENKLKECTTSGEKTRYRSSNRGILKTRSFTDKKSKKTCTFLFRDKENMGDGDAENGFNALEDSLSSGKNDWIAAQEREVLRQSLENCFEIPKEDSSKQADVVFTLEENESPVQSGTFHTPHKTPSRELAALDGEVFRSSVVRFCLMDSTPLRKRQKMSSEKRVLTPVRRTTRWERCGIIHPKTIEEKNVTVESLDELSAQLRSGLVFRPNLLLPCSDLDKEMRYLQETDA